jgi:hypothetical protein
MPTSSPGAPAGSIETLGLPTRAVTALTRAGISDVAALAALTRRELTAVPGLGAGLVTAIRRVVPEPPATLRGAGAPAQAGPSAPPVEDDGGPAAPEIPSFASLRDPRRRTALDLLVPAADPAPEVPPAPPPAPAAGPAPVPRQGPAPGPGPRRPAAPAPRPAEYADLVRLGVRLARAAVAAPGRVLVWSVRTQVGLARRLLGG